MYTLDDEYNYIDNIKKELKFLTNSKVRLKLLICLYDSELTVKELHEKTNLNYSSITNNLNKLEEFEYINKILINWSSCGFKSVDDVKNSELEFKNSKKQSESSADASNVDKYKALINNF